VVAQENRELWARYDELLTAFERTRRSLTELRDKVGALSATAESKDGLVTAMVGPRGELTGLEFSPRTYRHHSPTQLAELVRETVAEAIRRLHERAAQLYEPFLPTGVPYDKLLSGEADVSVFLPDRPLDHDNFDEWWRRFRLSRREGAGNG
jgi:DNA-binding protein YbaB